MAIRPLAALGQLGSRIRSRRGQRGAAFGRAMNSQPQGPPTTPTTQAATTNPTPPGRRKKPRLDSTGLAAAGQGQAQQFGQLQQAQQAQLQQAQQGQQLAGGIQTNTQSAVRPLRRKKKIGSLGQQALV